MTEGIVIGVLVLAGTLVARYMKTHPFYRYKTQKHKEHYQAKMNILLSRVKDSQDAYWISRALTDIIFDFRKKTYHDYHVERYQQRALSEKSYIYQMRIEDPAILCEKLVERAVEMKIPLHEFSVHMRDLWRDYLVPIGRLTPKSIERMSGAGAYYSELSNLPASKEDIQRFLEKSN
jgi:hypothetical protein